MYLHHKDFFTPEDNTVVWHYFTLQKFLGLLESSELFFSRQDQFDDKKEGHLSDWDKELLSNYPGGIAEHIESDKLGCFYANCWTINNTDEYVLWNTYASLTDGVAVKSTVGRIKESFDKKDDRPIYISKVQYYNERDDSTFKASGGIINLLALGFSKRKYFSAEKELRLLYHDNDARMNNNSPQSVSFTVDLKKLIVEVYVSPRSYDWFRKSIAHLMEKYGIDDVPVNKSLI